MIKKRHRLRSARHIDRAIKKGITFQGPFFRVKAFKKASGGNSRMSVIMSAKRFKGAVLRNLIRRRLKAAFYNHLKEINGWDLAVFPNDLSQVEFAKVEKEAERCFDFLQSK